ncbi:hypothetical protein HDU97_003201 [Phlyctochytrium planicorne]|nr:hypothetical protein HDU97_003201 [Phlyctochytrium planicorne]
MAGTQLNQVSLGRSASASASHVQRATTHVMTNLIIHESVLGKYVKLTKQLVKLSLIPQEIEMTKTAIASIQSEIEQKQLHLDSLMAMTPDKIDLSNFTTQSNTHTSTTESSDNPTLTTTPSTRSTTSFLEPDSPSLSQDLENHKTILQSHRESLQHLNQKQAQLDRNIVSLWTLMADIFRHDPGDVASVRQIEKMKRFLDDLRSKQTIHEEALGILMRARQEALDVELVLLERRGGVEEDDAVGMLVSEIESTVDWAEAIDPVLASSPVMGQGKMQQQQQQQQQQVPFQHQHQHHFYMPAPAYTPPQSAGIHFQVAQNKLSKMFKRKSGDSSVQRASSVVHHNTTSSSTQPSMIQQHLMSPPMSPLSPSFHLAHSTLISAPSSSFPSTSQSQPVQQTPHLSSHRNSSQQQNETPEMLQKTRTLLTRIASSISLLLSQLEKTATNIHQSQDRLNQEWEKLLTRRIEVFDKAVSVYMPNQAEDNNAPRYSPPPLVKSGSSPGHQLQQSSPTNPLPSSLLSSSATTPYQDQTVRRRASSLDNNNVLVAPGTVQDVPSTSPSPPPASTTTLQVMVQVAPRPKIIVDLLGKIAQAGDLVSSDGQLAF